jgi:peptide/nickel transport system permease protein
MAGSDGLAGTRPVASGTGTGTAAGSGDATGTAHRAGEGTGAGAASGNGVAVDAVGGHAVGGHVSGVDTDTDAGAGSGDVSTADAWAGGGGDRAGGGARRLVVRGAGRLAELVAVVLLASVFTFLLASLLPGDPAVAILGPDRAPEDYARVRTELGLDEPVVSRYLDWLGGAVQGDLGRSLLPPHSEVTDRLAAALPVSLELAVLAIGVSVLVAVPLAMWCAHKPGGRVDRWVSAGAFAALSLPQFLVGLLLILVLVKGLGWFPRSDWSRLTDAGLGENLRHAALPVVTIALGEIAIFTRLLRADLVRTLGTDYVRAARARGLSPTRVLARHALRPSSFSFVTLAGVNLGRLIGSTVIVERVFGLPGVGSLLVSAATQGDVRVVQGVVLVVAVIYVAVNGGIDLLYGWLDPRIRRGAG